MHPPFEIEGGTPAFLADIGITDLESASAVLKKRLPLILPTILIGVALAGASAYREVDVYATAAKVLLAQDPVDPTTSRYAVYYDSALPSDFVNTEIQVIRSRLLATIAVEKRVDVQKALGGNDAGAIGAFEASCFVRPLKDTRIVEIGAEGTDPRRCALFANALAEAYCDFKQDERSKLTAGNVKAISEQLPKVLRRIEESRRELDRISKEENTIDHEKDLVLERLRAYHEALNASQRERVRADSEIEAIERVRRADRPIESAPSIATSGTVQRLRSELAQTQIELNQLLERYQEDCPLVRVKALKTKRDDLRLQLASEIETIRAGLTAFRDAKLAEENGLEKVVAQFREEARRLGQQEQRYVFLQKDLDNNQRLYEELLRRSTDLSTYNKVETSSVKIIDRAEEPGAPFRPNRPRTIMLGALFGLMIGLSAAYAVERLDSRIRSADAVRHELRLDVLALVPDVPGVVSPELERFALTRPESPFAEAFRRLRAQLQASGAFRVVLVTSGAPAEGKSTAAVNLAIAAASAGARVCLIDADMRNPSVHSVFKLESKPGLADCLGPSPRNPLDLTRETEVPNLSILAAGHAPRNAAELLATGGHFEQVLTLLRTRFDRLVIDTPPAAFLSDASIMAPFAESVILVVSTKQSRRRGTRLALTSLTGVGAHPLGVVLNHLADRELKDIYYRYYDRYSAKRTASGEMPAVETRDSRE